MNDARLQALYEADPDDEEATAPVEDVSHKFDDPCGREIGRYHRFVCVRPAGHDELVPPVPHLYRGGARMD